MTSMFGAMDDSAGTADIAIVGGGIAAAGRSPAQLLEAASLYNTRWKPEADAVSWMSVRSLFENLLHMLRASITMKLGSCIFSQAKSADLPYSEVRRKAERLWPLWA